MAATPVYSNDPGLLAMGALPFRLGTAHMWYDYVEGVYDYSAVSNTAMDAAVVLYGAESTPLVINIEEFDLVSDRLNAIANLQAARAKWAANARPIGYYMMLPERNWQVTLAPGSTAVDAWKARNDANATDLLTGLEFVAPSVYNLSCDYMIEDWIRYADMNIREARRVAGELPVYPFLYHTYAAPNVSPIESEKWNEMVRTVAMHEDTDAMFIHYQPPADGPTGWRNIVRDVINGQVGYQGSTIRHSLIRMVNYRKYKRTFTHLLQENGDPLLLESGGTDYILSE